MRCITVVTRAGSLSPFGWVLAIAAAAMVNGACQLAPQQVPVRDVLTPEMAGDNGPAVVVGGGDDPAAATADSSGGTDLDSLPVVDRSLFVATAGDDSTGDGSEALPFATIARGIAALQAGDTLVVEDGVYTGYANRIAAVPSGTAERYTTVRARRDWAVTIRDTGGGLYDYPVEIDRAHHVVVRGFKLEGHHGGKLTVRDSSYVKIIRCSSDGAGGSASSFEAANSDHVLFEENLAYGEGRYPFAVRKSTAAEQALDLYVVFRRNVCRHDYSDTPEPLACFATYQRNYVAFQNNLVIDGLDIKGQPASETGMKGFFNPNGGHHLSYVGNLVLDFWGAGIFLEGSNPAVTDIEVRDNVIWNVIDGGQSAPEDPYPDGYTAVLFRSTGPGPVTIDHNLFGVSDVGQGLRMNAAIDEITNSIVTAVSLDVDQYAITQAISEDYNVFWANTDNRNLADGIGPHSRDDLEPRASGLRHLPRVESGSALAELGSDSGPVGASMVWRIGVSGTVWGEEGWDQITDEPLWPFPNEGVLQQECADYHKAPDEAFAGSPEIDGARGFAGLCGDDYGQVGCLYGGRRTLTSYVWEYLGSACPAEICPRE